MDLVLKLFFVVSFLFILALSVGCTHRQATVSFSGQMLDSNGNPIYPSLR